MKIVISEIPDEGLDVVSETAVAVDDAGEGVLACYNLHVMKSGTDIFITGSVIARGSLSCSRCLRGVPWESQCAIDSIYVPVETVEPEHDHELMTGDMSTAFYSGNEIDLNELVTEQVLLSSPMKPLCSESCKGICSGCGADLNAKQCECLSVQNDNHFAVLEKLLHEGKE